MVKDALWTGVGIISHVLSEASELQSVNSLIYKWWYLPSLYNNIFWDFIAFLIYVPNFHSVWTKFCLSPSSVARTWCARSGPNCMTVTTEPCLWMNVQNIFQWVWVIQLVLLKRHSISFERNLLFHLCNKVIISTCTTNQ